MRAVNGKFFLCKVEHEIYIEGEAKHETNVYAVDAVSFGDAEKRITEYISPYCDGELDIKDIKIASFAEVFLADEEQEGKFYVAKVDFVTIDERSGKDKRVSRQMLYQAGSLDSANKMVSESLCGSVADYDKVEIKDAKIASVIFRDGTAI